MTHPGTSLVPPPGIWRVGEPSRTGGQGLGGVALNIHGLSANPQQCAARELGSP